MRLFLVSSDLKILGIHANGGRLDGLPLFAFSIHSETPTPLDLFVELF